MARTLKDQFEETVANTAANMNAAPERYTGDNWFHLSEAEEEVFSIDRRRWPRMMHAFECYEAFKLLLTGSDWDEALIDQARQQWPEWCGPDRLFEEFCDFAGEFGVTNRDAHAVYSKQEFWEVREGVAFYADERPKPPEPADEGHAV